MPRVRRGKRGFVLTQVLLAVMLLAAWGAMAMAHAAGAVQRASMAREALHVRLGMFAAIDLAFRPPDLGLLCLSSPLAPQEHSAGGGVELRWRHLGNGIIMAEVDVAGTRGGRLRTLIWMVPEVIEAGEGGIRCPSSRLRSLGRGSVIPRPGE